MLSPTSNTKSLPNVQGNATLGKTCLGALRYVSILLIAFFVAPVTMAETLTNPNNTANSTAAVDPQAAPSPNSPFTESTPNSEAGALPNANGSVSVPNSLDSANLHSIDSLDNNPDALANPGSLASQRHPSDMDLSTANQRLLSQNAQLRRDANALETRVNVLINERSGQLFMYGAITVSIALFAGFMLGWFVFGRRERW